MVSKVINYNKLPSFIVSSPLAPFYVAQRPLSFTFVGPNAEFYIRNRRQFSIYFKNKVNNNTRESITPVKTKRAKGCFGFYYKDMSFENSNHANVTEVQ